MVGRLATPILFLIVAAGCSNPGGQSTTSKGQGSTSNSSDSVKAETVLADLHELGYEGELQGPSTYTPIAKTHEKARDFRRSLEAKDPEGIDELLKEGSLVTVPNGTRARVIEKGPYGDDYRIRLLSGTRKGEDGWVFKDFVK